MSFVESLAALSQRIPDLVDHLATEEATKNALVMPFIAALGYDVFNPQEVVPELNADVGVKKGEKVDYAIRHGGEIVMLFECKSAGTNLGQASMSQLYRYFAVTNARIGVLTNGTEHWFFSDLEEPNKMDQKPFLVLDLTNLREDQIAEVQKLTKESFDLDRMLSAANELKYTREVMRVLNEQIEQPDVEFVRFFFTKAVPNGRFTSANKELFERLVQKALQQFVRERVSQRLRSALKQEDAVSVSAEAEPESDTVPEGLPDDGVVTTEEEVEGYHIVKAIVREVVDSNRVAYRDTKSYMGILLDDNNRKPICRLRFNWSQKYLGLFDADKNEIKHSIESLDDIYQYASELKEAARRYDGS